MLLPYSDQGYVSRCAQARYDAASHAGQASGNPSVYLRVVKGYTTALWQDGVICGGLAFHLQRTAGMNTLRHASGVI